MNILSVGFDQSLFDKNSDSYSRQKFYSTCVDSYTIIVFTLGEVERSNISSNNLLVISTNSSSRWFYPLDALKIAWNLRKEKKFSLVTVQDPFMAGLAGILVKIFLKIPLNIQIHTEFFNSKYFREESLFNWFLYRLGLLILPFADTIRSRNQRIKRHIVGIFPKFRNKVFYVGVRINEIYLEPLLKTKRDKNLIISVGRFVKQKNFPLLRNAFKIVKNKIPKAKLVLVGDGPGFIGWKEPEELKTLYDRAAVFVLSSNHEGWGLVVLEALARGCPVVMTDTGCAGEIVINNETGRIAPVGATRELAKQIINSLEKPQESVAMAKQGRKLVVQDSDLEKIRTEMLDLFHRTITHL